MKISLGDYFYPKDKKIETLHARTFFLHVFQRYAPETMKFIKDKILPIYNKLLSEYNSSLSDIVDFNNLTWRKLQHANEDCSNCLIHLIEIINEWSNKFNLSDEWVKDMLLLNLSYWKGFPPEKKLSWDTTIFVKAEGTFQPLPITITIEGWNSIVEPWEKFKKRMNSEFQRFLKQHKKEVEESAKKSGLVKARNRRQIAKHMHWLIKYQICKKSYGQISQEEKVGKKKHDESTIIKAINNTARLIGLTLKTKIQPIK